GGRASSKGDRPSDHRNGEADRLKPAPSLTPPSANDPIALDTFDGHLRATGTSPDKITRVKQRSGLALRCRVRWRGPGKGGNRPQGAECDPQGRLNRDRSRLYP